MADSNKSARLRKFTRSPRLLLPANFSVELSCSKELFEEPRRSSGSSYPADIEFRSGWTQPTHSWTAHWCGSSRDPRTLRFYRLTDSNQLRSMPDRKSVV